MPSPEPTYLPTRGGPLDVDRAFYDRLSRDIAGRTPVESFVVPIRSGRAWPLRAGQMCRIVTIEAAQVADLNAWNLHNPRERFWAARTRQLQRAHVSTYDRLWSTLPYLRPMLTITKDSLDWYGVDDDGGRCHGLLGSRCDPYVNRLLTGESFDYHCHSNLTRAVLPWRLTELDVHDVLNVFQVEGLTRDGDQYFIKPSPARRGDVFEFFAEIDLLVAISTCPGGDLSVPLWGPNAGDPLAVCRPLGVEIYEPDPTLLAGWSSPAPADYRGNHGMPMPLLPPS
ncbi:MAG TPA: urea carboxylase-associated family protein [Thermodesulfobacteriota bacterium]